MAFAPHSRVSFGGTLSPSGFGDTGDIWQCNVSIVNGSIGGGFDNGAYLEEIAGPLLAWYQAPANGLSIGAFLRWVKCNAINADGTYFDGNNTNVHDYPGDLTRGGAQPKNPDIISIATSWRTSKARGPGSHGRIYLPNNTYGETTDITIAPPDQLKAANAGKALLQVLANGPGITVTPVVASKVNATNTPITRVAVGSVKDVQRRRKNAIKETYTVVTAF